MLRLVQHSYGRVRRENSMVKEKYNHWLPPLLGATAVTINDTIYYSISEDKVKPKLRRHEMVHIQQFEKMGVVGFFISYFSQYLNGRLKGLSHWDAYYEISLEKEAFEKQGK